MANHVFSRIQVFGNPEVIDYMNKKHEEYKDVDEYWQFKSFYDNPDADSRQWMFENVGPKWIRFEDYYSGSGEVEITVESAWCYPKEFIQHLTNILVKIDPMVEINGSYEDECWCFVGGFASSIKGFDYMEDDEVEMHLPEDDESETYDEEMDEFYDLVEQMRNNFQLDCARGVDPKN